MYSLLDSKASTKEIKKLRGDVMIPFELWLGLAAIGIALSVGVMAWGFRRISLNLDYSMPMASV